MSRYQLRVIESPGQPAMIYETSNSLMAAISAARRIARTGFVGAVVEVVDSTIDYPIYIETSTGRIRQ